MPVERRNDIFTQINLATYITAYQNVRKFCLRVTYVSQNEVQINIKLVPNIYLELFFIGEAHWLVRHVHINVRGWLHICVFYFWEQFFLRMTSLKCVM